MLRYGQSILKLNRTSNKETKVQTQMRFLQEHFTFMDLMEGCLAHFYLLAYEISVNFHVPHIHKTSLKANALSMNRNSDMKFIKYGYDIT